MTNVGTDYDEDVRVTLFFNQYDLLTAEDIMNFDEETVSFILDKQDFEDSISIKKGIDFLAHFESNTHNTPNILEYHQELPFKKASKKQQCENIKIFLGYHYILDNDNYVVELVFDKINQNTSVAFPTVILLKNHISKINYIIKSKKNPVVYKGCINVS